MKKLTLKTITLIAIILGLGLYRLLPHPFNFTPVMAMALFAGAYFDKKYLAFIVPLIAMLLSDLVLGLHNTMLFVYGAITLSVLIGFLLRNSVSPLKVFFASISGTLLFFIITNFGVWLMNDFYTKDLNGLIKSYVMALPFLQRSLLGDLFFSGVLFFSYQYFLAPKLEAKRVSSKL